MQTGLIEIDNEDEILIEEDNEENYDVDDVSVKCKSIQNVNEKKYTGFFFYKAFNSRMISVVLNHLINFNKYDILFISDSEGKVIICNVETEKVLLTYETKNDMKTQKYIELDDTNPNHFILTKENNIKTNKKHRDNKEDNHNNHNNNTNNLTIFFLPNTSNVIKFNLEIINNSYNNNDQEDVIKCTHESTNEIIFKNNKNNDNEKQESKMREQIIKVTYLNDVLGNIIETDFEDLESISLCEAVCISYNKYL